MPITDDAIRADLARRIYVSSHLTGEFTLRSGRVSNEYFDKYRFESDPLLLADVAEAMATLVPEGIEVLAGLEMGRIPVVTALARVTSLPTCFVRKEAKKYGTAGRRCSHHRRRVRDRPLRGRHRGAHRRGADAGLGGQPSRSGSRRLTRVPTPRAPTRNCARTRNSGAQTTV